MHTMSFVLGAEKYSFIKVEQNLSAKSKIKLVICEIRAKTTLAVIICTGLLLQKQREVFSPFLPLSIKLDNTNHIKKEEEPVR